MKKHILLLLIALPAFAFAQIGKGKVFIGGSLTTVIQSADTKSGPYPNTSTLNNFGIAPSFGFFLSDKVALGGSLSYSNVLQKFEYPGNSTKYETSSFGISPYLRYYIPLSSSIYFGLQGGLNFSRGNSKTTTDNGTIQTTTEIPIYSLGLNFRPVFIFFPSSKWGIEASIASLGYTYTRNLPDVASASSFGLNAGSFSFGVAYYFAKQ